MERSPAFHLPWSPPPKQCRLLNPGAISPVQRPRPAVGIGTRIFLGGGIGYVAWVPALSIAKRLPNRTPVGPAATLALIGDAKRMNATGCAAATSKLRSFLNAGRGCTTAGLEREVVAACAVRPRLGCAGGGLLPVASAHLWFGELCPAEIWANYSDGKPVQLPLAKYVPVAASSLGLKKLDRGGNLYTPEPIASIPMERLSAPRPMGRQVALD